MLDCNILEATSNRVGELSDKLISNAPAASFADKYRERSLFTTHFPFKYNKLKNFAYINNYL